MNTVDKLIEYIETFQDEKNWSNEIWLIKVAAIKLKQSQGQSLPIDSVVWQSEQLCEGLHSTDFNGKCFKCGKQVLVREPK